MRSTATKTLRIGAAFQIKLGSEGYPPDLDTLVKGVDSSGKKVRFLRRIPVDPMTGKTEWGMRSMQDDPDSDFLGRAERVRRLHPVAGHRAGRHEVQGLVDWQTAATRQDGSAAGFTLIEMMIVISMILILVSIAIPVYNRVDSARQGSRSAAGLVHAALRHFAIHPG